MDTVQVVVVALALTAAALSALSGAGEQRAASRLAHGGEVGRPRTRRVRLGGRAGVAAGFALALVSSPLWLGSWLVDAGSFVVQATALHLGSLSIVQPLMVMTLLFSVPLAARGSRHHATAREWAGAVAVVAGLLLVLSTRDAPHAGTPDAGALLPAMVVTLLGACAVAACARGRRDVPRAALLSVSAGMLFSLGAATTKLTAATAATGGIVGLLTSWPGYALAAVSFASFGLQQAAYATGPLAPVVTAVVIVDPLGSYALGVVGFGEPLPAFGIPLGLAVLGAAVLVAGVATLARSPLLQPAAAQPDPAPEATVASGRDEQAQPRIATASADQGAFARDAATGCTSAA